MKTIPADKIRDAVSGLCLKANFVLRPDVRAALTQAYSREDNKRAKDILAATINNAQISEKEKVAICQDTGMPCVFVELGDKVKVEGNLNSAINKGIESGYKKGYLRNSIVKDPLLRGKPGYGPAMIHIDIVRGDKLKLTVLPKGFGCENKTQFRMFKPTADIGQVKEFIVEVVKAAGPDACPPYVVGVGIGGTADYACLLAKKAFLPRGISKNKKIEADLLKLINKLKIGPMGLGGKTTALAVRVETYPTHIAGLPVCVNISCHALRSATKVL